MSSRNLSSGRPVAVSSEVVSGICKSILASFSKVAGLTIVRLIRAHIRPRTHIHTHTHTHMRARPHAHAHTGTDARQASSCRFVISCREGRMSPGCEGKCNSMLRPFWAILRRLGFNLGHLERILPQRGAQDHQKGGPVRRRGHGGQVVHDIGGFQSVFVDATEVLSL